MLDASHESDATAVRFADPGDEPALVDLCRAKHAEEALRTASGRPFRFAEDKVRARIQQALVPRRNAPDAGQSWCGVIGEPGQLQGAVYLMIQEPDDSDELYLLQLWNWIFPEYRRSKSPAALIQFSQALSVSLQLPLVGGVVSYEQGESAKLRFLRRNGMTPIASLYLYNAAAAGA